jgi:hypothetical protein
VQPGAVASPELRCEACAVLEVEEERRRETRTGLTLVAAGIALLVLTIVMWRANWNPGDDPGNDDSMGLIFYVATGAIGLFGIGFGMITFRPRLRH